MRRKYKHRRRNPYCLEWQTPGSSEWSGARAYGHRGWQRKRMAKATKRAFERAKPAYRYRVVQCNPVKRRRAGLGWNSLRPGDMIWVFYRHNPDQNMAAVINKTSFAFDANGGLGKIEIWVGGRSYWIGKSSYRGLAWEKGVIPGKVRNVRKSSNNPRKKRRRSKRRGHR